MNSPRVSIIVPVYNIGENIDRCVSSVLAQTCTDFELLLVDDGSTDNSYELCISWAEKDKRIKVFHKANGGVSSARNMGLQYADGQWIAFVDADDWLEEDFLSNLLIYQDYSFIVGGFKRVGALNDQSATDRNRLVNVVNELGVLWGGNIDKFIFWYVWGKLFKKDIIDRCCIRFHEAMKYSEDLCFVLEYMSCVDSFMYVSSIDYIHYFEGKRSSKYKMNFDEFRRHIEQQESSFFKLEIKTGHTYSQVRQNVHRRFFDCFIYNLLNSVEFPIYRSELSAFKRYDKDRSILNEVSYSYKRSLLRFLLFALPSYCGFLCRNILRKFAYHK